MHLSQDVPRPIALHHNMSVQGVHRGQEGGVHIGAEGKGCLKGAHRGT